MSRFEPLAARRVHGLYSAAEIGRKGHLSLRTAMAAANLILRLNETEPCWHTQLWMNGYRDVRHGIHHFIEVDEAREYLNLVLSHVFSKDKEALKVLTSWDNMLGVVAAGKATYYPPTGGKPECIVINDDDLNREFLPPVH